MSDATEVTASFTRPNNTTAYTAGDLIANNVTAGSVVPLIFDDKSLFRYCFIRRVRLFKNGVSLTNASFRVHLFKKIPTTIANGDNGVFSVSNVADYLGAFDTTLDRAFTDGSFGMGLPLLGSEVNFSKAGDKLYGLLEARAAYTPVANEVFTAILELHKA